MGGVTRLPAREDEWAPIIVESPAADPSTPKFLLAKTEADALNDRHTVTVDAWPGRLVIVTFHGRVPATWWAVIARIQSEYAATGALPKPHYVVTESDRAGRVVRMSPVAADGA